MTSHFRVYAYKMYSLPFPDSAIFVDVRIKMEMIRVFFFLLLIIYIMSNGSELLAGKPNKFKYVIREPKYFFILNFPFFFFFSYGLWERSIFIYLSNYFVSLWRNIFFLRSKPFNHTYNYYTFIGSFRVYFCFGR